MIFISNELNHLNFLFLECLRTKNSKPLHDFISIMNLTILQARVPVPQNPYATISFIGFLWSQPRLVEHPHFEFAMIEMIGALLHQMRQNRMDELAMRVVLNADVLHHHPVLIAIQQKKWAYLEFIGRACSSYFAKYPKFAFDYGQYLLESIVNHPEIFQQMNKDELKHVLSWGAPFLIEIFQSRQEMYRQLEHFLEGQLLGVELFVNPEHSKQQIKTWIHVLNTLLFKDIIQMDFINKHFLHVENEGARIIDQIIIRTEDNPELVKRYLKFVESLYLKKYISRDIYKDIVLNHLREGYSPLHELVYRSCEAQLTTYFTFIENAVMNGHLLKAEVDAAIRYLNKGGFSLISQACNNHKASVTQIFFDFCERFYNEDEIISFLKENKSVLKCSKQKTEFKKINDILKKYRLWVHQSETMSYEVPEAKIGHMDLSFLEIDEEVTNHFCKSYVDLSFIDEKPDGTIKFEFYATSPNTIEGRLVERLHPFGFFEKRTIDSPDSVAGFVFK
jgi:hypothetical protein